jgi:2-polyprenyl-3-methyl-5-hydroxy-6-metoxy-1,4-benzoquinol methylase
MNRKEENQVWNKFASQYEEKFMSLELYDPAYEFFLKALGKKSARVLDIGCGPGNISRYLLNRNPDLKITGIDYSDEMIKLASANIPEGNFMVMDCREISGFSIPFDGIVCGFVVPYLTVAEMTRFVVMLDSLLAGKGILFISFVEGSPQASGPVTGSTGDSLYFHYHDPESIIKVLTINNMRLINEFRFSYTGRKNTTETHTVFLAEKL